MSIYDVICSAVMENEEDYDNYYYGLVAANYRLRIIKKAILVLNLVAVLVLVDSNKARAVLIVAYLFYTIVSHLVDLGTGIVHTIEALGDVCFNYEEETESDTEE